MRMLALPSGECVPALGQGTWNMGDDPRARAEELSALRIGIEHGLTLIDTAEMYGDGRSETLVGEAIAGQRENIFLVSKVLPGNASRRGTVAACERSLKRMRTDRIDLYLLHWRGAIPFAETLEAFTALQSAGKIRHFGVSNLDLADMKEFRATVGGEAVATNQLLYNLSRRGIEWDLLPWMRDKRVPLMAYSPLEQARLLRHKGLVAFSERHGMTPAQATLAWVLAQENLIAIPKSANRARVLENRGAIDLTLSNAQQAELSALFPPPHGPGPLAML